MRRGRSVPSARSDSSEMDTDGTELEIAKLQRQIRIMEGDQRAYKLQAEEQIHKQQQEMEKLLKEQEELHQNLAKSKNISHLKQDSEDAKRLCALLEQDDMLKEALRKEKLCQKEIEKQITDIQLKLADLRKGKVSTSTTQGTEERRIQKAKCTLEYKLDRALTCLNKQLTKNGQLRKELQTLLIERVRFQQLRNRLEKEMHDVRKNASLSTAAYDARVEAQSKMTMMREKAVKDLAQHNAEMKELERLIAHECSLKEFMTTKCNERSENDDGHEMAHGQLSELKEQRRVDSEEESLSAVEELFKKIQTVTGEDNLDLLVTRFIQVEEQNFALFNFVNEQNKEAEAFRDQIRQMQAEIEQFRAAGLQQEKDHHSYLRHIDEQQKKTESQAEDYESQASIINKFLDEIKTGVSRIFSQMECDCSVAEDTLGSSTGITENDIMSYLGLLEEKTNELLTIQAFLNSKDQEKDYNPKELFKSLLGQNPELLQQPISIQPAVNIVDDDAEESPVTDEEERPLSQEELRRRIIKKIQQKERSVQQAATKVSKISQQDGRRSSLEDALI